MTPYEQKVRKEIEDWKSQKDGLVTKALNVAGKPIDWVYEKVLPGSVQKTVGKAVSGFIEMLKDAAQWTYPDKNIVKEARKVGIEIDDHRQLRDYDIKKLDQIARRYFSSNKIIGALEGAGCGLGGFALIAADIPLLFTVSFRAVQQIGSSYGFDMEDPDMLPVVMSVFNAGATASEAAKTAALADMRVTTIAFSKNWTYKKVAETTQTGIVTQLLKERTKRLPKDIANNITKRKLAQVIPLVGSVIGAGFNYWFLSNTVRASYMIFRDMHLNMRYDSDGKPVNGKFEQTKSAQCSGTTKSGKRCSRITKHPSGYCYSHRN